MAKSRGHAPKQMNPQRGVADKETPPPDFVRTSLHWLPIPKPGKRQAKTKNQVGLLQTIREMPSNALRMWSLLEMSLPPLLDRKYHIVNVSELMKNSEESERHYMGVATWFVLWCESFGIQYLNSVHVKHEQLDKINKKLGSVSGDKLRKGSKLEREMKEWKGNVDEILQFVGQAGTVKLCSPTLDDNCKKASEFLLEPCVVIQLPWNTVLLHQWLAAALVEVLIFEQRSLELRHWPFPVKVASCVKDLFTLARDLVTLVKQLKERIVLGFAILSHQVTYYPQVEASHPGWIMDEVVLPSLATLQFLISGKAYTILKSIKKIAWSKSEPLKYYPDNVDKVVYMPVSAYFMDNYLSEFYVKFCYTFQSWESVKPSTPFPACKQKELEHVIHRMRKGSTITPKDDEAFPQTIRPFSLEERYLVDLVETKQESKKFHLNNKERIDLTLKTIKELVIDPGRLPNLKFSEVEESFDLSKYGFLDLEDNVFVIPTVTKCMPHYSCLHSLMHAEMYSNLIGCHKSNSALSQIVTLGLEILEREQMICLTKNLCNSFDQSPVVINLDKFAPMSSESMHKLIQDCYKRREKQTRNSLLSQLPQEWKEPVNLNEPEVEYDMGMKSIVKTCEDRIGRIIFNVAQKSFDVYEKGGSIFPHWQTVQYILPCYIASFLDTSHDTSEIKFKLTNFLKLLNELLIHYEHAYHLWYTEITPRQPLVDPKSLELSKKSDALPKEIHIATIYFKHMSHLTLTAYIGSGELVEGIHGLDNIHSALMDWPLTILETTKPFFQLYFSFKTWLEKAFFIHKEFYEIYVSAWKPAVPGTTLANAELSELYWLDSVMNVLEVIMGMSTNYPSTKVSITQRVGQAIMRSRDLSKQLYVWRLQLFCYLVRGSKGREGENLKAVLSDGKKYLAELFIVFKLYLTWYGEPIPLQFVKNLIPNKQYLKLAAMHFIKGNISALEKMLPLHLFSNKVPRDSMSIHVRKCRSCSESERVPDSFVACDKCLEQRYPDVNYFCTQACKEIWWKAEHMAEHLEFELGLDGFSQLDIT